MAAIRKLPPDEVRAGATILVAGSAVFNRNESVEDAMRRLRESIRGAGGAPRYAV